MSPAYLLVSHGSRDRRPQIAMQELAALIRSRGSLVDVGYLELSQESLHEQIRLFALRTLQPHLKILPLFLQPGVHVMEDIPSEVAQAKQALGKDVIIELQPYLGSHPSLKHLLFKQIEARKKAAWIFLAHGSRRPGANAPIEEMARSLGAVNAYWSIAPSLESRIEELVQFGHTQIGILPYFLFTGGITDTILGLIEQLKLQFPKTSLDVAEPLGVSAELADLIWDLLNK